MASPYDSDFSAVVAKAVGKEGVLQGEGVKLHDKGTVICIGMCVPKRLIVIQSLSDHHGFYSLHPPAFSEN